MSADRTLHLRPFSAEVRGERSNCGTPSHRWWSLLAVLPLLWGCAARERAIVLPSQSGSVGELLAAHPADPTRDITPILLDRSERTSRHLVYIRTRERPHVHATHDLAVTLLRGRGTVWIDGTPHSMRAGDVVVIAAGTPHYFVNEGDGLAASLAVFSPPSDGTDQVFLDQP